MSPSTGLELEPDLQSIFETAAEHYGIKLDQLEPDSDSILWRAFEDIANRTSQQLGQPMIKALHSLSRVQGTDRFPSELAAFLLVPNMRNALSEDVLDALLREAARQQQ